MYRDISGRCIKDFVFVLCYDHIIFVVINSAFEYLPHDVAIVVGPYVVIKGGCNRDRELGVEDPCAFVLSDEFSYIKWYVGELTFPSTR